MSASLRLAPPDRRDLLEDLLAIDESIRVETARDGFLSVRNAAGAALRIYYYPYPLIDPEGEIDGLYVASPIDLALMKLGAIISRGTARDFADLYCLCRRIPLNEILERSPEKFGHVRDFPLQALKSLADFSSAGDGAIGRLRSEVDWSTVRAWSESEATRIGRESLGL